MCPARVVGSQSVRRAPIPPSSQSKEGGRCSLRKETLRRLALTGALGEAGQQGAE